MGAKLVRPPAGWSIARVGEGLQIPVPGASVAALGQWLDLLATWNARVDLTAARGADELVDLMLADALVLSAHVPHGARVVDVGTGAGAPGLALAILRPDLEVSLVEPLTKRSAFLRTVIGTLSLDRTKLDPRKGELVATTHPHAWDVALARATLGPTEWLALAARLVNDAGAAWVFLAKEPNPSHPELTPSNEISYEWPMTRAARRLVRYERSSGCGGVRGGG